LPSRISGRRGASLVCCSRYFNHAPPRTRTHARAVNQPLIMNVMDGMVNNKLKAWDGNT
jgi:hypothetical protein